MCEGGENCLKHLKRGWNRKEGRANKDFLKGGKLGQGAGALKRGSWNPLPNYVNNKRKNIKGKTKKSAIIKVR